MPKSIIFCADGTWNGSPEQTGISASAPRMTAVSSLRAT